MPTLANLCRDRLVLGWQTLDRVGDTATNQPQTISTMRRYRASRKTETMQSLIKHPPCMVASERTTSRVGPVFAGRQTHYKKTRIPLTEGCNGPTVISWMHRFHRIHIVRQPRARPAIGIKSAIRSCRHWESYAKCIGALLLG